MKPLLDSIHLTCHLELCFWYRPNSAYTWLFLSFSQYMTNIEEILTKWRKHWWFAWDLNPGSQDGRCRRIHWAMAAPHLQLCSNSIPSFLPRSFIFVFLISLSVGKERQKSAKSFFETQFFYSRIWEGCGRPNLRLEMKFKKILSFQLQQRRRLRRRRVRG